MEAVEDVKKEMQAKAEEVKRERHCSSIARRWWGKAKIAEAQLIVDDDFQKKAEAKIDSEENSGIKNKDDSLSREEGRRLRANTSLMQIP